MRTRNFWKPRKIVGGLLVPLLPLALAQAVFPAPANAYPRPGITERVSVASDGAEANLDSSGSAISADGRHVAFLSGASNLVPGDTNGFWDIFVHDRETGTTERVSVASDGAEANSNSSFPAINADGRYVAFTSRASNLVPGDTNGAQDVFVHDRVSGITERVSVAPDGAEANANSNFPVINADGRYVAFDSDASNLVPGDTNGWFDVFVHDRATGTTERVSVASDGTQGAGAGSSSPAISAEGRHVAFTTGASNLVPGDTNNAWDILVHDRETGTTERVSVASDGAGGDGDSFFPEISADGRHVALTSHASNLVPRDSNGAQDVFVHDRATGTTERVSVASDGAEANAISSTPAISANGRHVAFHSTASNLVPRDSNERVDVFVHDRAAGATERVSVASERVSLADDGTEADSNSLEPKMSADGRYVAFHSWATNLLPGDTNRRVDVFVHDRGRSLGVVGTLSVLEIPGGVGVSGRATFSGATLAGASDPDDDGTGIGPLGAADAGAELTGAALIYRPELEDLHLRLDLSSLPSTPAGGGLPGVLYGARLRVGDTRYEVRAGRSAATAVPHRVALYRCDPDCTEHAPLTGSFGTTGAHVRVSVPLAVLGAAESTELTGLRAFTAFGEAFPGALETLDEVDLPDAIIPEREVSLGIAPVATPADQVVFPARAVLQGGAFSGVVDAPPGGGNHHVWARVCMGEMCEVERVLINFETLEPTPTSSSIATYYFHSSSGSNNLDQIDGSATFDSVSPTSEEPATALDVPGFQNVSGTEVVDPVWRGELSGPASSLTVHFWGRTLPGQAAGSVDYTMRVSTGGEYFELAPAIQNLVLLGNSDFIRVTNTFDRMIEGDQEVPLKLPAGPFTIAIQGTFTDSNAATEIRFDSVDFPSGFTTFNESDPDATPTPTPTPSPTPSPTQDPGERGTYPQDPNDPYWGDSSDLTDFEPTQWAPRLISAPDAWQQDRATGFGIRVAVLDTGVDLQHEDLQCAGKLDIGAGSDVVSNDSDPDDENGHGTHVAGIIGACTNNGIGVAGVAPDATIVPVRVLNEAGSGTDAQIVAGLDKAVELGVHVVNMSLGYPPGKEIINDVSAIDTAIDRARDAGIVVVAAAGNDSFPLCEYPALAEDVICVGATDARDLKAFYSVFPIKTDAEDTIGPGLVAPGGSGAPFCDTYAENVLSTIPLEFDTNGCTDVQGYANDFGTSMAAPHVAGVAALVYDRLGGERNTASAQAVIEALVDSADDLGTPGYDPVYGFGRLNARAAVCAVGPSCGVDPDPTPTPTVTATPTTDPSKSPTTDPSESPTDDPSESPTDDPSESPTPTDEPTQDPGPVAPVAPSNLTASAASSTRIQLGWSDNSNNETSFAIERSDGSGNWQEIAASAPNQTSFVDVGLQPNTTYNYRVRAYNSVGHSDYSNVAAATTPAASSGSSGSSAPLSPGELMASASSSSRIELSWSDGSNNEDGFALERSSDGGTSWQEIATTGRNQTSYLDTGLSADTSYHYRVRAYNSAGHSVYSNVAAAKTAPAADGEASPEPSESSQPVEPVAVGSATTSITASRELVGFKKGVELSGVVQRDDNCTGPLEVEVSRRIHGTNSYRSLDSTPVNGAGAWGLQVTGKRNAAYVAQIKDTDGCHGEASVPTDVLVRAKIAVKIPNRCRGPIRGRVRPANEGEVVLQRRAKGRWNEVASKSLNDRSRFSIKAKRCGKHRLVWSEDGAPNEPTRKRFRI